MSDDLSHEKAALNAYMATQFNTAYTAASKPYENRVFSLPFFSNPLKDIFSKTQRMYNSGASALGKGNYNTSIMMGGSLGASGTSYISGISGGGYSSSSSGSYFSGGAGGSYSSCSGGGCYK